MFLENQKILKLYAVYALKKGEKDDKIIAVCADDPEYRHYNDIKELPPHRLAEIRRFFEDCECSFFIFFQPLFCLWRI